MITVKNFLKLEGIDNIMSANLFDIDEKTQLIDAFLEYGRTIISNIKLHIPIENQELFNKIEKIERELK
jgi:hypothetical protein